MFCFHFCCFDENALTKGKAHFNLQFQVPVHGRREGKAGTPHRQLHHIYSPEQSKSECVRDCYSALLLHAIKSRTEAQGIVLNTVCWVFLHQLAYTDNSPQMCPQASGARQSFIKNLFPVIVDCVNLTIKSHHYNFLAINTSR